MEGTVEEGAWVRSCRIFVGGLGEAVTESDLERTFSSLGEVKGVEVVRTKGRTFAYLNFLPFSNKSMGKLFSMVGLFLPPFFPLRIDLFFQCSGCMWKDGRLKIEKAKEHYIVRLKREWEEDASLLKEDSSLLANKALLERSKKGSSEQMQLHLCFPKLRKKSRTIIWNGFVASLEGSMDDIGNKARKVAVQSHVGMGSLDVNSEHELFEDESLVSPDAISRKSHSLQINQNSSFSIDNSPWANQRMITRFFNSIRIVIFSTKINLLLPFGPLAILVHFLSGNQGWVFLLSLIGIIPLAERLGYATEQLAFFTGATVGGLLNATFGNATELIISIYALKKGMLRVVQQSLLGSILSNMLLVLGCAFLSGGIVFYGKEQSFNKANAVVNSGLLLMAVMGLLFPAVLHYTHTELHYGKSELALSRFSSCIMLFAYACFLFFQLQSQKNLYSPVEEVGDQASTDDEVPEISKWESIVWLGIITAWISVLSEYLVDAIEGASSAWKMPMAFISVILLPIVGNAAEHASAVMFAMKDKLDISLGVAIGSSTQISMFGIPFCVVIGWIMGRPMDLNFQLFETANLFVTVVVVAFLVQEGTSNYFKGLMLVLSYLIVAASFYVHVDPKSDADKINAR